MLPLVDESLRTYFVLATLAEHGELSQQQVCDRIDMDRSDMVRLIDGLETRGHVVRIREPDHRRRHQLTLTASGKKALRGCETVLTDATSDVFTNLSAAERDTLHRLVLRTLGHPNDIVDLVSGSAGRTAASEDRRRSPSGDIMDTATIARRRTAATGRRFGCAADNPKDAK